MFYLGQIIIERDQNSNKYEEIFEIDLVWLAVWHIRPVISIRRIDPVPFKQVGLVTMFPTGLRCLLFVELISCSLCKFDRSYRNTYWWGVFNSIWIDANLSYYSIRFNFLSVFFNSIFVQFGFFLVQFFSVLFFVFFFFLKLFLFKNNAKADYNGN